MQVDIDPGAVHIPDGALPLPDVPAAAAAYEAAIAAAGGIDLQLLGIGRIGHIGFNERGSLPTSRTRLVTLDRVTRVDAAADFFGEAHVPRRAITMGVGTIMEVINNGGIHAELRNLAGHHGGVSPQGRAARQRLIRCQPPGRPLPIKRWIPSDPRSLLCLQARRVVLMAFGEGKAEVLRAAVEDPPSDQLPASFLQAHPAATAFLDAGAAAALTRVRCPWVLGPVAWDAAAARRAAVWLALRVGRPLLRLTDEDYTENSLQARRILGGWKNMIVLGLP